MSQRGADLGGPTTRLSPPALAPQLGVTVSIPQAGSFLRRLLAFGGPGYIISVGYMDPGNWATDLAGGSAFGYSLLWVICLSSLLGVVLQSFSLRLGIVTGHDLAQNCRRHFPKWVSHASWVLAELGIIACDLAEVIGSAIALQLLFALPLLIGVVFTGLDCLIVLALQSRGIRSLEAIVAGLILLIGLSFAYELMIARPDFIAVASGLVPRSGVLHNSKELFIALGILGATVMPHNLYLHSALVQTRNFPLTLPGKREAIRFSTIDTWIALFLAFLVNAAILILASAAFHRSGHQDVTEIQDAYWLLSPLLGGSAAAIVFAMALLLSGQNATLTGTLAGQIVMEGFLSFRLTPWITRLITRSIAIVPAAVVVFIAGERAVSNLLLASQVVLALQLPFAMVPLIYFVSNKKLMGVFVLKNSVAVFAWILASTVIILNVVLLVDLFA